MNNNTLLVDESPLLTLPTLAVAVGDDAEAIILQQIHYLANIVVHNAREGYRWVYKSYSAWQRVLPWLTVDTIRNKMRKLKEKGLIITAKFSNRMYHNTLWYRIDYARLQELLDEVNSQEDDDVDTLVATTDDEFPNEASNNEVIPVIDDEKVCGKNSHNRGVKNYQVIPGKFLHSRGGKNYQNKTKKDLYTKTKEKYKKEKSPVTQMAVLKTDPAELDKVIDYLNQQAKTHYRKNATNRDLVKARINEGYTIQDCLTVIDNKTAQWLNTEWEQYLRPRTLFQKSKFESYLNTKPPKRTGKVVKEQMPDYNQQAEQPKPVDRQRIKELSARLEKLKQKQKEVSS